LLGEIEMKKPAKSSTHAKPKKNSAQSYRELERKYLEENRQADKGKNKSPSMPQIEADAQIVDGFLAVPMTPRKPKVLASRSRLMPRPPKSFSTGGQQVPQFSQTPHSYNSNGFCKRCGWERLFIEKTQRLCVSDEKLQTRKPFSPLNESGFRVWNLVVLWVVGIIATIATTIFLLVAFFNSPGGSGGSGGSGDLNYDAYYTAKQFIQKQYPGAKSFSDYAHSHVDAKGNDIWWVTLNVDGVNAFNAPIRNTMLVEMKSQPPNWYLVEIDNLN